MLSSSWCDDIASCTRRWTLDASVVVVDVDSEEMHCKSFCWFDFYFRFDGLHNWSAVVNKFHFRRVNSSLHNRIDRVATILLKKKRVQISCCPHWRGGYTIFRGNRSVKYLYNFCMRGKYCNCNRLMCVWLRPQGPAVSHWWFHMTKW